MKFDNFAGNLGNELIKEIYRRAYSLEATEIVVHRAKYNSYAIVDLFCEDGAIAWNMTISL